MFIIIIILVERIPGIQNEEKLPKPPLEYTGPYFTLPKGFKLVEISNSLFEQKYYNSNEFKDAEQLETVPSIKGQYEEVLFTTIDKGIQYRILCNFGNHDFDCCLWIYSLWVKEKSNSSWKLLGPFLPCLGVKNFPVFDITANISFIKDGNIQWIIRERNPGEIFMTPAHKREIKNDGKIWKCSIPLSTYVNDSDNDQLTDIEEAALFTDPNHPDTDRDGIQDGRDLSPHGWCTINKGSIGLNRHILENILGKKSEQKKEHSIHSLKQIYFIESSGLRIHVDTEFILLALKKNEERIFRNRIGVGESLIICNCYLTQGERFFFGAFGLIGFKYQCGVLNGKGLLIPWFRLMKKWKISPIVLFLS